jgi:hypothetical protein
MMRPPRRYSIAGKRFEDVLRVHRDQQIRELKAENAALKQRIEELEGMVQQEDQAEVQPEGTILCDNCDDFVNDWIEMDSLTPGGEPDKFCHSCAPRYQEKDQAMNQECNRCGRLLESSDELDPVCACPYDDWHEEYPDIPDLCQEEDGE